MVAVMALVAVSMTETVLAPFLVTYNRVPSALDGYRGGRRAHRDGGVVALVAVLITEIVPAPSLAT